MRQVLEKVFTTDWNNNWVLYLKLNYAFTVIQKYHKRMRIFNVVETIQIIHKYFYKLFPILFIQEFNTINRPTTTILFQFKSIKIFYL